MTPNERAELNNLRKEIDDLKAGLNIQAGSGIERLMTPFFLKSPRRGAVTNNDVKVTKTVSITIGAGGGTDTDTVEILDFPDRWIYVFIDGKLHRVPAYLEEFDASRNYGS